MSDEIGLHYVPVNSLSREVYRMRHQMFAANITVNDLKIVIGGSRQPPVDPGCIGPWKTKKPFDTRKTLRDRLEEHDYILGWVATEMENPSDRIQALIPRDLGLKNKFKSLTKLPQSSQLKCDFFYTIEHEMEFSQPPPVVAVQKLENDHADLFALLQLTMRFQGKWTKREVILNGGIFSSESPGKMEKKLNVKIPHRAGPRSLEEVPQNSHKHEFEEILSSSKDVIQVIKRREIVTLFNVLHCHVPDLHLASDTPSSSKAIQVSWKFPVVIQPSDLIGGWRKYVPVSDWSIIFRGYSSPFFLSEVISMAGEEDRYRMLAQGLVAKADFFVVCVYLKSDSTAERYIFRGGTDKQVHIHQKDFDLKASINAVHFLRELYNLRGVIAELEKELDPSKKGALQEINDIGRKVVSLSNKKDKSGWALSTGILQRAPGSVAEEGEPNLDDDLGVFGTDEGAAVVEYVLFGHPFVAYVWDGNNEAGIFKFVPKGQTEVDVLQYLNAIDSPKNHTVRPIQLRSTSQGMFVHLPPPGVGLDVSEIWTNT
ncbi:uncharacterized protein FIBRA_04809 [Fibroporia radiculosa]|uniref:Uncharacterized protein n=1 Tax=Fibroporia radiculosa TaxID=599839 RepID=J4G7Z8_9APHY|nr:uncharacterized protein FIBRA_04809 [Fibroporia radiculosa]CCM02703.1 predicted protein [Fibroporia radiculosa]